MSKNIHNLLSDAFVAASLQESDFDIRVVQETSRLCVVTVKRKGTDEMLRIDISHASDGFIRRVESSANTLIVGVDAYTAFLDTIYNHEFMSF